MEFKVKTPRRTAASKRRRAGFTLAEVLVALGFMAIITPVVVQGLKLASLAGEAIASLVLRQKCRRGHTSSRADKKTGEESTPAIAFAHNLNYSLVI